MGKDEFVTVGVCFQVTKADAAAPDVSEGPLRQATQVRYVDTEADQLGCKVDQKGENFALESAEVSLGWEMGEKLEGGERRLLEEGGDERGGEALGTGLEVEVGELKGKMKGLGGWKVEIKVAGCREGCDA